MDSVTFKTGRTALWLGRIFYFGIPMFGLLLIYGEFLTQRIVGGFFFVLSFFVIWILRRIAGTLTISPQGITVVIGTGSRFFQWDSIQAASWGVIEAEPGVQQALVAMATDSWTLTLNVANQPTPIVIRGVDLFEYEKAQKALTEALAKNVTR